MEKIISWFSCGITSAVACKLAIEKYGKGNILLAYIDTGSGHPDNKRFIADCEKWYGMDIQEFRNFKYRSHFDVCRKIKYINGVGGAACTLQLKKKVRYEIEKQFKYSGQIFGFEFAKKEINRGIRFSEQYPKALPLYPLIDAKLTKEMCADIILKNGIALPTMYELGYHNNNCIGCLKGGKGYWNKIRIDFPLWFDAMSKTERFVGHSCIKNCFLDELEEGAGRHDKHIVPECGHFCEIEFANIIDDRTNEIYTGLKNMKQLNLF